MMVKTAFETLEPPPERRAQLKNVLGYVTTVVHALTFSLIAFVVYLCFLNDSFDLRTWHAFLYTIGWFLLSTEAILYLSTENLISRSTSSRRKVNVHWMIVTIGLVLTVAGYITIFIAKSRHFTSLHGIAGFTSGILALVACLSGVPAFFSFNLRNKIPPIWSKLFHAFVGTAAVVFGAIALITAFHKKWFVSKTNNDIVIICFLTTVLITCWTLLRPSVNMFGRARTFCN